MSLWPHFLAHPVLSIDLCTGGAAMLPLATITVAIVSRCSELKSNVVKVLQYFVLVMLTTSCELQYSG